MEDRYAEDADFLPALDPTPVLERSRAVTAEMIPNACKAYGCDIDADEDEDPLSFFRGLLFAIPISIILWGLIIAAIYLPFR